MAGIAIALSFLPASHASEADTSADEAAAASTSADARERERESAELSVIIVTAQRRAEDLQDVAIAVSAFDGDDVRHVGVTDAKQLQLVVPSLTYAATGHAAQPYLRGVGTRLTTLGLDPSIATYVDDRYVPRPFAAMFDMLDVARVEVLKGPQGTLYGRNAAGGAIHAVTKDPSDDPSAEIGGKFGDYDLGTLDVLASGPLADSLRGQIAAGIQKRDGFATNLVPSGRGRVDDLARQLFRGKLYWDLGKAVEAKLGVSWWKSADWVGRDLSSAGAREANRGVALYGGVTSRDRDHFASTTGGDNDLHEAAVDLRFDVRGESVDFVSVTTYTDGSSAQALDADAASTPLIDIYATEDSTAWSQELHLLSKNDAAIKWIAGLFYYRDDGNNVFVFRDTVSAQPLFPVGTDVSNGVQHVESEAYALFAEGSHAFTERWTATLGARLSRESKAVTLAATPDAITNAPTPFASSRHWDETTPRATIEYRDRFGLVYLTYSRSFKSGGFNYPASLNPTLDPEIVDSYELGLKANLLDNRVRINPVVFVSNIEDLQVTRGGTGAFLSTENAADAKARGVEVDVDVAVSASLTLTGGLALIDSEYTDYTAGVFVPLYVPPYGSAPLPGGLDVRGRSLLRSPDRAMYVGARYERRLAAGGRIPLSVNYSYKGDYYFDFSAVPATEWLQQRAYGVLSARIGYAAGNDRWEVGFWGTNLTDEDYYDDAVLTAVASRVSYADPRMLGVDFRVRL